ncbi:MAG: ABC transporter substrate-binding protein, partial [Anaerolineae bacterium]|nr:ABC transporter substrate-binding protein [Anaerolineae bacterium]
MKNIVMIFITLLSMIGVTLSPANAQDDMYTVGIAMWFSNESFIEGMAELGYIEGENITYIIPTFEGLDENSPPELFMEMYNASIQSMVDAKVDAIFVNTDTDAVYIQTLTTDIPIVFGRADDPVATGAVLDLVTPGKNATGTITNRPHERRLQILTEIKPDTKKVYYLYSTATGEAESVLEDVQAIGNELGIEVVPAPITDLASALELLNNTPEDADWLFLTPYVPFEPEFYTLLYETSARLQIGITGVTDQATQGYLMGYGPNIDASNKQGAQLVDLILRGANPAELPVQTAENYLMINLEAAEQIN